MSNVARNYTRRILMVGTASAAWFALLLQAVLTLRTASANGATVVGAILTYLSFFTLLTNILVALVLTFSLFRGTSRWERFFSSPIVATGTALYIATVGVVYSVLLRHTWNPEGLDKLADVILHDVVPVLYVLYWIFFVPKSGLRWKHSLSWIIYPIVYLVWVLIRGASTGRYPYAFVDVGLLGYPQALLNATALLAVFLLAGIAVVAVSTWKRAQAVSS